MAGHIRNLRFGQFPCRDVDADCHIGDWFSVWTELWSDGCVNPVQRTIFCFVAYLTAPDLAVCDLAVHVAEKLLGMSAGVQYAMIFSE